MQPWLSFEAPMSSVRALGLPCFSKGALEPEAAGSNQAPVLRRTTPRRIRSLRRVAAGQGPRALKGRIRATPRSARGGAAVPRPHPPQPVRGHTQLAGQPRAVGRDRLGVVPDVVAEVEGVVGGP